MSYTSVLKRLSVRDMTVLSIVAEMYGAPMDVVASMLRVSQDRAYRIARGWTEATMISPLRVKPVPGYAWIFPTRAAGEALTGRQLRAWVPTPKMAAHVRTTLEVRLALVGLDLDRWVSERALRGEQPPTRAGVARSHIHDGRFRTKAGDWWAVEVELSPKDPAAARSALASAVQVARSAGCVGVTYYCRGERVKNVIRTAAAGVDFSDGFRVTLDDVDALLARSAFAPSSPGARPGFRVIEGGACDPTSIQVTDRDARKGDRS
ncbi:hypothetical protein [Nocardia bovistercoris]|uniref:Uncharacterized protein n=1 Tax=Nocardia bovistercoris TaxID=2785916 RepID=A0A931N2V9_9NOCA|nr:hypothetical protein [Nocardia bovistercoris]MBH0777274.1 hypothetical protein [Nocardia bovistercoris]